MEQITDLMFSLALMLFIFGIIIATAKIWFARWLLKRSSTASLVSTVTKAAKDAVDARNEVQSHNYKRATFLSKAELNFYRVLLNVVDDQISIIAKVRQADVLEPNIQSTKGDEGWRSLFNRVQSKHFDFALCRKDSLEILCVIELDDSSHKRKSVQKRDAFVEQACASAGLPIERFRVKRSYRANEVREQLTDYLGDNASNGSDRNHQSDQKHTAPEVIVTPPPPKHRCKKCGSEVIKRKVMKGKFKGRLVWHCNANMECGHVEILPRQKTVSELTTEKGSGS